MQKMASKDKEYTEEQYRTLMKNNKRVKNAAGVCPDRKNYELIITRRATDTKRKFFQCEICERITTDYGNLLKHCRMHVGDKRYKCCVCGKGFTDSSNRDKHCLAHDENYFWHHSSCRVPCCDKTD